MKIRREKGPEERPVRRGEESQEMYRELSSRGRRFCAAAGVLEEAVVFMLLDISLGAAPLAVVCFLWFLFAFLTGAAVIGADLLCTVLYSAYRRTRRFLYWRMTASCAGQGTPVH